MATERLVRESIRINRNLLHVTVNPIEQDIPLLSPGMVTVKTKRIKECEDLVKMNCLNTKCLRLEIYKLEETMDMICAAIQGDES